MNINFSKYHGTGNDFIMVDGRRKDMPEFNSELIAGLCHRRFGIGADGLIIVREHPEYAFEMKYFNSNGKEGSMCGNGGRCAVSFAGMLGMFSAGSVTFMATDGLHEGQLAGANLVKLKMNDVDEVKEIADYYFVDTGSPHVIILVDNIENIDVAGIGRKIRYNRQLFPEGANVNFISFRETNTLNIRTYERGVEDETWSCGTGSVASAVFCAFMNEKTGRQIINLKARGGELEVDFESDGKKFRDIHLTGPVIKAFDGVFRIN